MPFKRSFWLMTLLIVLGCHAHVRNELIIPPNIIPWSADSSVHWQDFQGRPPFINAKAALTGTLINYKPTFLGNAIRVEVIAYFLKDSSWRIRRPLGYYVLNHERRHFDIAEIDARRIRKYLQDWRGNSLDDYNFYIMNGRKSVFIDSLSAEYDLETNHSRDTVKQELWNLKIDSLLEVYKPYEITTFKISIGSH